MSQALLSRAPSELRALAGAIRMGRLTAPFSAIAIRPMVSDDAESVTHALGELAGSMSATGIAHCLELLAQTITERPRLEDLVHIVATGPQVAGVANRDTGVAVSELFSRAETSVVVVGYAVYQGQKVFQALAKRMVELPNLKVRLYLDIGRKPGDTSMESELVKRFCHQFRTAQWPSGSRLPEIYYDPRSAALDRNGAASLHAKCVIVDGEHVFISSANFTEAGQHRNIELGLRLNSRVIGDKILQILEAYVDAAYLKKGM
jgi:phosphatidylserine/phosphatidylglycerophosphate/cardiolipin synthase-like enzyme